MEPEAFPAPVGVAGPLGIRATLRAAVGLYGADLVRLWATLAVVVVPIDLLGFVLREISLPAGVFVRHGGLYELPGTRDGTFLAFGWVTVVLTALGSLIATGATFRLLLGRHLHHSADTVTSLAFALERFVPLVWVSLVYLAAVLVGLAALLLPGVYVGIAGALAVCVLMAEDRRGFAALGRSLSLTRGRFVAVFCVLVVSGLAVAIGRGIVAQAVTAVVTAGFPHSVAAHLLALALGAALASILCTPLLAAATVVLYVDLLLRRADPHLARLLA